MSVSGVHMWYEVVVEAGTDSKSMCIFRGWQSPMMGRGVAMTSGFILSMKPL